MEAKILYNNIVKTNCTWKASQVQLSDRETNSSHSIDPSYNSAAKKNKKVSNLPPGVLKTKGH